MSKYEGELFLEIDGVMVNHVSFCFPTEAAYLEGVKAINAAVNETIAFREAHPHDVLCAQPGHKGACVNLRILVRRDGKIHVGRVDPFTGTHAPTEFPLHDVPAEAVKEMERVTKKLLTHPTVAKCLLP